MSLRILALGVPKSGKTSSFASLANNGWKIRYLDFDGNADPLVAHTQPAHRGNVEVVSCLDQVVLAEAGGGEKADANPKMRSCRGWAVMARALNKWPTDDSFSGDWDPTSNVLIIDSATSLAVAKVNAIQFMNNRYGQRRTFTDYELTQTAISGLLAAIKLDIKCPMFLTAHIQTVGPDLNVDDEIENIGLRERVLEEKLKGATKMPWAIGPMTIGKAQVRSLASDFNGTALIEAFPASGRRIRLQPMDGLALGLPVPGLKNDYSTDDGWGIILDAWRKNVLSTVAKPAAASAKVTA